MHHSLEYPSEGVVAADLGTPGLLRRKLCRIQQRYWEEFSSHRGALSADRLGASELALLEGSEALERFIAEADLVATRVSECRPEGGAVIFEGAQGVLLDEWRGFHPYTTWSTCTFDNALDLVGEWGGQAVRLGVVRSYATRHGAGPFPTEDRALDIPEPHNGWGPWQEGFRRGWLDLVLLRYAVEACGGLDGLAVTHLEKVRPGWKLAQDYSEGGPILGRFRDLEHQERLTRQLWDARPEYEEVRDTVELLQRLSEIAPVELTSWGPTAKDKRFEGAELLRPLLAT